MTAIHADTSTADSADSELLSQGLRRIAWAEANLRLLRDLRAEFTAARPFEGMTIGVSLHIEPKTAVLLRVLQAGGAEVVATGNLGTTQRDVLLALQAAGIVVYGARHDTRTQHLENIRNVLRHQPQLLLDNGADLATILLEREFSLAAVLGGTEETTSGGNRLREELSGAVAYPVIVINDSPLKLIVENKHAVGQSVVESFMRITNLMIPGKRFVVVGFGWVGKGVAQYFRSFGGLVAVVEHDPIRALEAAIDGYRVAPVEQLVAWGQVFVTSTGQPSVLAATHFEAMADGTILANAGHFDWEIAVDELRAAAVRIDEPEDAIEAYTMRDGRRLMLIAGGKMLNLAGRTPKGNSAEAMDLGFTLQALSLQFLAKKPGLAPGPHPVPQDINLQTARRMLSALMD